LLNSFVNALTFSPHSKKITPINFSKTRYLALLSDIHANLPALETVLTFLKEQNIQQGLVLGDTVGYGPHPSQCIERVQATGFMVLKGNHDHGLATDNFKKGFSRTASWALEWSVNKITAEQKSWLSNLPPLFHYENTWLAIHGAPIDPTFFNAYVYEMTYHSNLDVLQRKDIFLCFHGHTHQPGVYGRRSTVIDKFCPGEDDIALAQFDHALICPGSVGQPRNGGIQTQFAIYDQKEQKVHYHYLSYDIEKVTQLMKSEGFPEALIKVLHGQF
jgi:predicted phosphodiesterase